MPLCDCLPCAISTGNTTTIGRETRDMQTDMQNIHESIEKICRAHLQHIYPALTSNVLVEGDLLKALLNSPLKSLMLEDGVRGMGCSFYFFEKHTGASVYFHCTAFASTSYTLASTQVYLLWVQVLCTFIFGSLVAIIIITYYYVHFNSKRIFCQFRILFLFFYLVSVSSALKTTTHQHQCSQSSLVFTSVDI